MRFRTQLQFQMLRMVLTKEKDDGGQDSSGDRGGGGRQVSKTQREEINAGN